MVTASRRYGDVTSIDTSCSATALPGPELSGPDVLVVRSATVAGNVISSARMFAGEASHDIRGQASPHILQHHKNSGVLQCVPGGLPG